jgi:hypothetical protein
MPLTAADQEVDLHTRERPGTQDSMISSIPPIARLGALLATFNGNVLFGEMNGHLACNWI